MAIIGGSIFVFICVFGSFAFHGGNLAVLWQPIELVIIFGAALGGVIISNSPAQMKIIMHGITHSLSSKHKTKQEFQDLLLLLYELVKTAKGNILALEAHVEKPESSDIFKRYPSVLSNHHTVQFIADTLKVQISSPVSPFDLEELMDADLTSTHAEEHHAVVIVEKVADALPGLGIVAAVLGVVYTMGKLTEGKEVIGNSVAAALVGTFLGVLGSYGFAHPVADKIAFDAADEGKYAEVAKAALLAFAKDCSPKVCVEFARRTIPPTNRPTFEEIDTATTNAGKAA